MRQVVEEHRDADSPDRLFKISLSKGQDIITIEEESKHIKSYLGIQHRHYQEKFDYDIPCGSVHFIMQDAQTHITAGGECHLSHGIKPMEEKGYIYIHIFPQEGDVILQVQDTGMGMDETHAGA